ncbi:MAG TPA: diaminopimelate decarboxylase [Alphaproteobacteria bacterium]|nr:diaminopimelate decarboxylase [Alphaproteobacteria bacterium]
MDDFTYRGGFLHAEDVPLPRIAEAVGTPFYCYSTRAILRQYQAFKNAFAGVDAKICYALKANANLAVVRTLVTAGAGADVVSEGELRIALAAGAAPAKIVFSGVGKTRREIAFALETGIFQINVESEPELEVLGETARSLGKEIDVAIRLNPDVDARTHAKITTGRKENKFGVLMESARQLYVRGARMPGLSMRGVAVHIGSLLTDIAPYREAFERVVEFVRVLRKDGHDIRRIDLGGGLGIAYGNETTPGVTDYAAMVKEVTGGIGCELTFEPGRFLVGNAGLLVSRVVYVKKGAARDIVIVDSAMNDLIRPALYDAFHKIVTVAEPNPGARHEPVDVVGPVCESADIFARARALTPVVAGDLLAICSAGAYASVMASTYNARLPAPEVMVNGAKYAVVRPRPDYAELMGRDCLPDWLRPNAGDAMDVGATKRDVA